MLLGNTLTFLVGDKQAFKISLADVAQTQLQGKNEVTLEFHIDDTTGANEKPLIENAKAGKKEAVKPKEEAKFHACGVTKKPKDPIINIDAEDADNELMQKPLIENAKTGKKDVVKPKEEVKVPACGVTKKPKDPIVIIDAEDVDNELAATKYIEDIYKFYKNRGIQR
ncbi:hypothetical protein ACS0TY_011119 [Phlomoides rotata]